MPGHKVPMSFRFPFPARRLSCRKLRLKIEGFIWRTIQEVADLLWGQNLKIVD